MTFDLRNCTVRWQFLKSLEAPRVVHVRCTDIVNKENIFSQVCKYIALCPQWISLIFKTPFQVTVRFHTQQTLAVYDRFGRLIYGSEVQAKDVLEYVVFEKHLANLYGLWRIHEKIIPDWMPQREPGMKTYVQPVPEAVPAEDTAVTATPAGTASAVA